MTIALWVISVFFCLTMVYILCNNEYLCGIHWFTAGYMISAAAQQFVYHDWAILIAEVLPFTTAIIGTLVVYLNRKIKSKNGENRYAG